MTSQQQPPPYAGFQPLMGQPAPYPQQPGYPPQPYPQQTGYPGYPPQPGMVLPQQQGYPGGTPNPGFSMGFVPPPPMHPSMSSHIAITPPNGNPDDDVPKYETGEWRGFSDKAIRAVFVRKVYAILMLQLAFTLGIICLFVFVQPIKWFVRTHVFVYYISYAIFMGVYISLVCCSSTRRKYPTNIILLSVFTMAMSYMLGTISCFHDTKVVLMAVGICAAVCLAVSLFSFHTKFDFTSCGGLLFVLVLVLFFFGIIAIFTRHQIVNTVYAGCGALVFVLFLAYDTQLIMGGKKHEMSAEEHIFAAICLYLDVVYIFMFLLMAMGGGKK